MRLAAKAYPAVTTAARETRIIRQFLEGLGSEAVKIHVGLQKPQTLQEAMQLAAEFEALAQTHRCSSKCGWAGQLPGSALQGGAALETDHAAEAQKRGTFIPYEKRG